MEGETLAERLQRGPVPLSDQLDIGRQIAEALDAAHERGILHRHRDLKPSNGMVGADGVVKVVDFGLATPTEAARPASGVSQARDDDECAPDCARLTAPPRRTR